MVFDDKSEDISKMYLNNDMLGDGVQLETTKNIKGVNVTELNKENDAVIIHRAMKRKNVIYDVVNDRILALTDDAILEIDEEIEKEMVRLFREFFDIIKKSVQEEGIVSGNITELLNTIEEAHASYFDIPEFKDLKKEVNKFLIDCVRNGNELDRKNIEIGLQDFFYCSRQSITKERKKFTHLPYIIKNDNEKTILRSEYIAELLRDGVVDYKFLVKSGVISELGTIKNDKLGDVVIIDDFFRKRGLLKNEELEDALIRSGSFANRKDILEYYYNYDRKFYFEFSTSEEIAKALIRRKLEPKEAIKKLTTQTLNELEPETLEEVLSISTFPKNTSFINFINNGNKVERHLDKKVFEYINREAFMRLVLSSKIKYKNPLESNDYIQNYGKLKSEDIILLQEKGFVNPEDIIKIMQFTSMKVQDENEYNQMLQNVIKFYNLDRLENLLKENKINSKFVELFNSLLKEHLTEEQRRTYLQTMIEDSKQKENSQETLILLMKNGIDLKDAFEENIPIDKLSELYIEEKVDDSDIISFYKKGLIEPKVLQEFFNEDELLINYKNGKVDYKVLDFVDNRANVMKEELENENIGIKEIVESYSSENGIKIDEFNHIVEGYNLSQVNISEFIPDDISAERVRKLFDNYYISHDDLSALVERRIITQEQSDEYATQMATHEQYEAIFNSQIAVLTTETIGETGKRGGYTRNSDNGNRRASKIKNDPLLQTLLLEEIGFDSRILDLTGYNNSLDGYKVYPSEDLGVMVFINNNKPQNATYVMSLQQGMYFLNRTIRENKMPRKNENDEVQVVSNATKRTLRETEHVKVKNASRGWGKNIVDSIKTLSPAFREKVKEQDKYRIEIDKIIEDIKDDYDLRKEI